MIIIYTQIKYKYKLPKKHDIFKVQCSDRGQNEVLSNYCTTLRLQSFRCIVNILRRKSLKKFMVFIPPVQIKWYNQNVVSIIGRAIVILIINPLRRIKMTGRKPVLQRSMK